MRKDSASLRRHKVAIVVWLVLAFVAALAVAFGWRMDVDSSWFTIALYLIMFAGGYCLLMVIRVALSMEARGRAGGPSESGERPG